MTQEELMRRAISLSRESISKGGGPFGAVIARGGEIVAEAANTVVLSKDPTAHAEVNAIRKATAALGVHSLEGCDIYCSCEPCPMCLGAIYWARLSRIFFACTREDAGAAGFSDDLIYREIGVPLNRRQLPTEELLRDEALATFRLWGETDDKTPY